MLESLGISTLIDKPNKITNKTLTIIDHLYTNNYTHNNKCYILFADISDHLPIFLIKKYKKNTNKKINLQVRDMSKFEHDQFLSDLEKNLTKLPDIQNTPVNESMTTFINIFETALQLHASLRNTPAKKKN